jgi:hypothetical protein
MRRSEFEHVIRAAANVVDDEIVVIGSQAVLAEHPDAPESLLTSLEVDVYPRTHPERAADIDGSLGDGSQFHETFAYYAHGVGPETAVAPAGWEDRLVRIELPPVQRRKAQVIAWCLSTHDLALAKLAAGRQRDYDFVTELVRAGLVDPEQLELGIDFLPESHREATRDRLGGVLAVARRGLGGSAR